MKLNVFTIVHNGEPYIRHHLPMLEASGLDFKWVIAHGVAAKANCTSWVKGQPPGLSSDGTKEYLHSISTHPRVTVLENAFWPGGKVQMVRECLRRMPDAGILMQIDSDECWQAPHLRSIHTLFDLERGLGEMRFYCDYFVGENIVTTGKDCYGNNPGEWARAWRYHPRDKALSHEPPRFLQMQPGKLMDRDATRLLGLVFKHYSWVNAANVAAKLSYYGYSGFDGWKRLQKNQQWPVKRLRSFLPWVDEIVGAKLFQAEPHLSPPS